MNRSSALIRQLQEVEEPSKSNQTLNNNSLRSANSSLARAADYESTRKSLKISSIVFSEKTEKGDFCSIVTRNCYVSMDKTLCSNIARF
jgi:hypothetical protein